MLKQPGVHKVCVCRVGLLGARASQNARCRRSLQRTDTRDELGIGSVRDAFADMLFPGTSTIMTRARYFLLVPWTYQRLERLREVSCSSHPGELSHKHGANFRNDAESFRCILSRR